FLPLVLCKFCLLLPTEGEEEHFFCYFSLQWLDQHMLKLNLNCALFYKQWILFCLIVTIGKLFFNYYFTYLFIYIFRIFSSVELLNKNIIIGIYQCLIFYYYLLCVIN